MVESRAYQVSVDGEPSANSRKIEIVQTTRVWDRCSAGTERTPIMNEPLTVYTLESSAQCTLTQHALDDVGLA